RGAVAVPGVRAREEAAVRAHAVLEDDPLSAPVLTLAALHVVERERVDIEPVAGFRDLDRAVEGVSVESAEHGAVAVTGWRASPAADLRLADREVAAGIR